ncbi:hypothetical protein JR316_0004599 [Psilocybe cubensis]|uniref:Btz domain-containing protein n=2 Tax=Psilocybe cubensis TaxID=181762 RepID=A0A8H8CL63_PSICU|nr:hypothetical protein JR316_0004599 [Psilocybe cubensis]KAH9482499.1 hypothetical protein JR316_0004599 [Psilocybe cubensis]
MPSVVPHQAARAVSKVTSLKPRAPTTAAPPKKRRVVRRRGRGRGDLDSDDEIEREAATDSDSDDANLSSDESATDDSDTEPASEDAIPNDRAHLPTPRNSKSPEAVVNKEMPKVNGELPSFFVPGGDWSEMVADEKVNGPADLPVIEFSEFSSQAIPQNPPSRKPKKSKAKRSAPSRAPPVDSTHEAAPSTANDTASAPAEPETRPSQPNRISSSQSARQAYQHKLETDPSFVPTIGNFWGHDDRLIDTELRSLSGWWRGRGRGRGRGFGGRGRGGFQGAQSRTGVEATPLNSEELPPIERAWTHDGFEDMKRKEEKRRAEQQAAREEQVSPKRGGHVGARGGFVAGRGRGGFGRGGFNSSTMSRNGLHFSQPGRIRFASKPELVWTTQHEAFLFFDPILKPRNGHGPSYRVKIPGHKSGIARTPAVSRESPKASTSKAPSETSETSDKQFIVRLPKRLGKERQVAVEEKRDETPIDEVFTVRPMLVTVEPISLPEPTQPPTVTIETTVHNSSSEVQVQVLPDPNIRSQLEQLSLEPRALDPERKAKMEEAVLRHPTTEVIAGVDVPPTDDRPALAPLQTGFTSPPPPPASQLVSQPSPAFGSPYGYHPQLPPGVAFNQHGMPYEVATGHPVYLQPPTMYNPRPIMPPHFNPGMPFVPSHMHHPSAPPPDLMPSHTPPMNGFIDPATGTPIFSFPRQTSRIEIRAPNEESGKPKSTPRTPSGLRTAAPSFQPTRSAPTSEQAYYQQPNSPEAAGSSYENADGQASVEGSNRAGMPGMVHYPAYQQAYYYPEPYGYPQYVDMSHAGQYDMYNMDQPPQGTVYY